MTYLYIKESPLGLKYLGVTIQNPYKYYGSGLYWRKHLSFHKFGLKDIKTTILLETEDKDEIKFWGMYYSKIYNVVEDKNWANLIPESGELSIVFTDEVRKKMSKSLKGKPKSEEHKKKMSNAAKGKVISDETKIKMRDAHIGMTSTEETKQKLSASNSGEKHWNYGGTITEEHLQKIKEANHKPIYSIDKDGNRMDFKSLKEAFVFLGKKETGGISDCISGKTKSAYGYKWYFKEK